MEFVLNTSILLLSTAATAILSWSLTMAIDEPPRKFGPEWTKDKSGDFYTRKQEAEVVRRTDPNFKSTSYFLATEFDKVRVSEHDGNRAIEVAVVPGKEIAPRYMSVEARKDENGDVNQFKVDLKEVKYFDLDGDGMIDAIYDNRGDKGRPMILFEGSFVQVKDSRLGFGGTPKGQKPEKLGIGRKVKYVFDNGVWNEVPVK